MAIEQREGIGSGALSEDGWCPACQADHEPPWFDLGEDCPRQEVGG